MKVGNVLWRNKGHVGELAPFDCGSDIEADHLLSLGVILPGSSVDLTEWQGVHLVEYLDV